MDRRLPWALAAVAVLTLQAAATHQAPVPVPLADVPDHRGDRVEVAGRVRDVRALGSAHLVDVTDGTVELRALLEGDGDPPDPGDEVRLAGLVRAHRGRFEVHGRLADVEVLEPRTRALTPGDLADDPDRVRGTDVAVRGVVRDAADGLRLHGPGASVLVDPDGAPPPAGAEVVVEGRFVLDDHRLRYELEGGRWRRP